MLHADADFADLFSVKEGRAPLGDADMTVLDRGSLSPTTAIASGA